MIRDPPHCSKFSWAKERQISEFNRVVPDSGPSTNEPMPIQPDKDSQGDGETNETWQRVGLNSTIMKGI